MQFLILIMVATYGPIASARNVILLPASGRQELFTLGEKENIPPERQVIWDETLHGPLPQMEDYEVVSLEKIGKSYRLVVDQAKLSAKNSESTKSGNDLDRAAVVTIKAKLDSNTNLTAAEQRRILQYLLKQSGM